MLLQTHMQETLVYKFGSAEKKIISPTVLKAIAINPYY